MAQSSERKQADQLHAKLRRALESYYLGDKPMDDADYDALVTDLRVIEKKHPGWRDWDSPDTRVIPPQMEAFPTRRHATPMLSLANLYNTEELAEWEQSMMRLLPDRPPPAYMAELKVDGLAIALIYEE